MYHMQVKEKGAVKTDQTQPPFPIYSVCFYAMYVSFSVTVKSS